MDQKQKALNQISQWNSGNFQQGIIVPKISAPVYGPKQRSGIKKWLPTLGAVGAGIAAAPFTGGLSLAGTLAALGGAAAVGGAAGEFGAQKSNQEKINAANILKEGAISGITGAVPIGGVAKAARVGAQLEKGAIKTGTEATANRLAMNRNILAQPTYAERAANQLAQSGTRLETRAGGFGIGEKMTGRQPITLNEQKKIQQTLRSEGIKPGAPDTQANAIQSQLDNYIKQMETTLSSVNRPLSKTEKTSILSAYQKQIMSSPTVDTQVIKNANQFANNFNRQVKDISSLNKFRQGLDKNAINYIKNPDSATTAKAEAATVMRRVASDNISKVAPVLKEVNTKYSNLNRAGDYLTQQAGRITRQGENAQAGLSGRILTGDVAQTVKSKSGALMQQAAAAKPSNTAAGRLTGLTAREGIKQTIGQAAVPAIIPALATPKPQPQDLTTALQQTGGAPDMTGMGAAGMDTTGMGGADMNAPQQQPMMSPQDLLAAVQANPKQASTYISLYKALQEAGGGKVTAAQQKQQMGVQAATSLVDNLENQLNKMPSGRIGGAAAKAQGFVMGSPAYAYEQGRPGYALMLIKQIQGSAGQISDADRQAIVSYVPSIMDTMQERQYKIMQLRNIIGSYSGAANANYGSQNTYDMSGMQ
jgi:hypothetical protein